MRLRFNWDLDEVVGHIPELMARHVKKFLLKKTHKLRQNNGGKQVDRSAGYGLELLSEYLFYVEGFPCEWLQNYAKKDLIVQINLFT